MFDNRKLILFIFTVIFLFNSLITPVFAYYMEENGILGENQNLEDKKPIYYQNQVAVLMYHHIDPEFKSDVTITPQLFQKQIAYLKELNYNFITLNELENFLYHEGTIPVNSILITFDDGYKSYEKYALPILAEHHIPSVLFHIVVLNGKIPRFSSKEIKNLAKNRLVNIQSHTYSQHKKWQTGKEQVPYLISKIAVNGRVETEKEYEARLYNDFWLSKVTLEKLTGSRIYALAYPFGKYNKTTKSILKKTGFKLAFTIEPGMVTKKSNPYQLPRFNAGSPYITPEKLHRTILQSIFEKN